MALRSGTMPATPEELLARLAALGIETTTHDHAPVFTVDESKRLRGDLPGGHCKNLLLKDAKGVLWLVVTGEDRRIDMKDLGRRIGSARLSFARPEALRQALGVDPGTVTPLALINDREGRVRVVIDRALMAMPVLNFHPLTNARTTAITPADLVAFIGDCGHAARLVDL